MHDGEQAHLAADVVALATQHDILHVLLIERRYDPYRGMLALPGGHVDPDEDDHDTARRELAEETGVYVDAMTFVGTYRKPGRDPRGRYVSFAWCTRLDHMSTPTASDDASGAMWVPVTVVLARPAVLAFDHHRILTDALMAYPPIRPGDPAEPRLLAGMFVRQVWVDWAREQPDPKPSWLLPWADLDPGQQEVDMRIGAALFDAGQRSA